MRVVGIFSHPKDVDVSRTRRDLILITDGENKRGSVLRCKTACDLHPFENESVPTARSRQSHEAKHPPP